MEAKNDPATPHSWSTQGWGSQPLNSTEALNKKYNIFTAQRMQQIRAEAGAFGKGCAPGSSLAALPHTILTRATAAAASQGVPACDQTPMGQRLPAQNRNFDQLFSALRKCLANSMFCELKSGPNKPGSAQPP